jgi:hypothetical protein
MSRPRITLSPFPLAGVILFVVGLLLALPISIVGNVYAGELLLALIALIGLIAGSREPAFFTRGFWPFIGLFFLSLCAYILTDLTLGTPFHDAFRGWGRFAFILLDTIGIYTLCRKSRYNLFPVFIGDAVGQIVFYAIPNAGDEIAINIWKYHLCLPILLAVLCTVAFGSLRAAIVRSILVLVTAGLVSLKLDTRAFGLICFAVTALVTAKLLAVPRIRRLMPVMVLSALLLAGAAFQYVLGALRVEHGTRQDLSNKMRVASILTALQTIRTHPLSGIGSWKTDFDAGNRHRANVLSLGGKFDSESMNQDGHSQLLQAWVEGGPFAALAFLYVLWRMMASLRRALLRPIDRFSVFAFFLLINAAWSCLFSPFQGGDARINLAVSVCICVVLRRSYRTATVRERTIAGIPTPVTPCQNADG